VRRVDDLSKARTRSFTGSRRPGRIERNFRVLALGKRAARGWKSGDKCARNTSKRAMDRLMEADHYLNKKPPVGAEATAHRRRQGLGPRWHPGPHASLPPSSLRSIQEAPPSARGIIAQGKSTSLNSRSVVSFKQKLGVRKSRVAGGDPTASVWLFAAANPPRHSCHRSASVSGKTASPFPLPTVAKARHPGENGQPGCALSRV